MCGPICSRCCNSARRRAVRLRQAVIVLATLSQSACASINYYAHAVSGQLNLLAKRAPIVALTENPETPEALRQRLHTVIDIRAFASRALHLPDNGSYRTYVDLGRPYVVWNVFATPEFSLTPKRWCFPLIGCVSYRGYFAQQRAERYASYLDNEGYDTYVGGARAYSTLGWFADPVLNTMLEQPTANLAGLIFHELAHQRLYLKGDVGFSEAFAVALEREGTRRWLQSQGSVEAREAYEWSLAQRREFLELIEATRQRLEGLYAQALDVVEKRASKAQILWELRATYRQRQELGKLADYEGWFTTELNNAKLAAVATYYQLVPAFERLLAFYQGDLLGFYRACEVLASLPPADRTALLAELLGSETTHVSERSTG